MYVLPLHTTNASILEFLLERGLQHFTSVKNIRNWLKSNATSFPLKIWNGKLLVSEFLAYKLTFDKQGLQIYFHKQGLQINSPTNRA